MFQNVVGVFAMGGMAIVVVVREDEPPTEDPDLADGVIDDLMEAFEKGDYYSVFAFDANGVNVDSIHSMAGYGGPKAAAKEAVNHYF